MSPCLAAGCVPVVLQACSPFVHGLRTLNVTVDVERDLKQSRSTSAVTFDPRGQFVRVTEGKPTERRTVAPYLAAGCVPVVLQACSAFRHGLRTAARVESDC